MASELEAAMRRKCNCAGHCRPGLSEVTRREFISVVGLTAASGIAGASARDTGWQAPPAELAAWKAALLRRGDRRSYRSGVHSDARLPLGGIGTGTVELGCDGRLTTWQLFNTLRDGCVPLHFAARCGSDARLLQTTGGPDWPRIRSIEMTGEYPVAHLRYAGESLPVELELTAFTPFSPLDTALSSIPVACFVFRAHNPTSEPHEISLAAFMENPVGYDAFGPDPESERLDGLHPNFGGNVNRVLRRDGATALVMEAEPGAIPKLDRIVAVHTNLDIRGLHAPYRDRPEGLTFAPLDRLSADEGTDAPPEQKPAIWLEEAPLDFPAAHLKTVRAAVMAGATLILSGRTMPQLALLGQITQGRPLDLANLKPDILFEDFEGGYDKWTVEGAAFGSRPATGTLPNQQPVTGFEGHGLVDSYLGGDGPTGRMISRDFTIERSFIRMLVGGGHWEGTQVRLLLDGKVVRTASGHDDERLSQATWDVREFRGKTAHIEIVDEETGGWGHINVDSIRFTELPIDAEAIGILDAVLPARFSDVVPQSDDRVELQGLSLLPDARREDYDRIRRTIVTRKLGTGKVILVAGAILPPERMELTGDRSQGYALLCHLLGADYNLPDGGPADAPGFGALALATLGPAPTLLTGFSSWQDAWQRFTATGAFEKPGDGQRTPPSPRGRTVNGAVASTTRLAPGETAEIVFFLAWRYPNKYFANHAPIGNHYAQEWQSIDLLVSEASRRFSHLNAATERFRRTFYDSSLPYWLLDCVTSQMATIRHAGVVFRTADGTPYGWEGSNGCCDPTCTHVWGYEQTLSRVFPDLERAMRAIDYKHQQHPDGGIGNRTAVPSPPHPTGERPFSDGHASCILKAYREALNSPDDAFLREYWPYVERAAEYLIARDSAAAGGTPAGVQADDQWNTYDEALHGVNSFISGYYLAALRAAEEWARRMNESQAADRFHAIFERGRDRLVELCWNGEYFEQRLPGYEKMGGEVGPGCMSDQLIGQWWAHHLGLGYILPREKVVSALRAIFKYNWKSDLTGWPHAPRAFAGARDRGLIICTWPRGGRPPHVMLYSDEVWTGIEYQVAAHMLFEGMTEEALSIAKGARDRYDGKPRPPLQRNPWNEIECGGHYARAMSSWSLLLAASGYEYDGPAKRLLFTPRLTPEAFRSFFAGPGGWGALRQTRQAGRWTQENEIHVVEGRFEVASLRLRCAADVKRVHVTAGGSTVHATLRVDGADVEIALAEPIALRSGQRLVVRLS
jgi:uncharacterized protein (DUF608 family)